MTPRLWDMHVHLDFMCDMDHVAREAQSLGLGLFATTVTPAGYVATRKAVGSAPNVRVGVGLHPWWVADGRCDKDEVAQAAELARASRYVGEIGLDLSPNHVPAASQGAQEAAFEALALACAETSSPQSPKVLSIHSVRAAGLALDILGRTGALESCACIFHWFSGTSDELHRAVKADCWFSINEMMLRTRRGREYARQVPAGRLLLETDLPPGEGVPFEAGEIVASLERTIETLAQIRGVAQADVTALTRDNSLTLLG